MHAITVSKDLPSPGKDMLKFCLFAALRSDLRSEIRLMHSHPLIGHGVMLITDIIYLYGSKSFIKQKSVL